MTRGKEMDYKTSTINNRRYLGNKYKLLPFITKIVDEQCRSVDSVCDIFAGTGAVSSAFADKILITNDIMYSNYLSHYAWFSPEEYDNEKIISLVQQFNSMDGDYDNYMVQNFANTYFSEDDCAKIGAIRDKIEDLHVNNKVNDRERAILVTSLLYAMDKIAKTCGHYDAYRKGVEFNEHLELRVLLASHNNNARNICLNEDANQVIRKIKSDLLYLDPPYNSRQYCDAYHLLENVALWQKPEVFGTAKKMDRSNLKSDYCTNAATKAFKDLIENANSRYILLSYNNMAKKGNDRSNAKINDDDIMDILTQKGKVQVFSEEYKAFSTGKSDIKDNEERLFLCTCED